MVRSLVSAALLLVMLPSRAEGPSGELLRPVRRPVGDRAAIDWSRLVLEVSATGFDPLLKSDSKPLEQQAISAIDARIGGLAALVPLRADLRLGDASPHAAKDALAGWIVRESRYYAAGPVEVVGELDLQPVAAMWLSERAAAPPAEGGGPTGVLIDARGRGVEPVLAPVITDPGGAVLYDGTVFRDVAYARAPVAWVSDPAHPDAQRAGREPAFFVAIAGGVGSIQLGEGDAVRFRGTVSGSRAIGEGSVVIVVDP